MSEPTKKPTVYVPKSGAKLRETSIGTVFNISFKVEEFIEFANANKNKKGYINLACLPRRAESDYGDTHSVTLDQWEPKPQTGAATTKPAGKAKAASAPAAEAASDENDPDNIPF